MTDTRTIHAGDAEELYEMENGESLIDGPTRVGEQVRSSGRWHEWRYLVIRDTDDTLWGIEFGIGLTEYQEHEMPWVGRDSLRPVPMVRLHEHTVITKKYSAKPAETDPKRDYAKSLILSHAQDVEFLTIGELLADRLGEEFAAGLSESEENQFCREVDDLIGQAEVTVSWPDGGAK